jgi:hypothetical protein
MMCRFEESIFGYLEAYSWNFASFCGVYLKLLIIYQTPQQ